MKARLQNGFGILLILSFFGYAVFSSLPRKQFLDGLICYTILFLFFAGFYWISKLALSREIQLFSFKLGRLWERPPHILVWLIAGIVLRLVFLWDTPTLSQDFFRFIWDGHLLLNGLNPYVYIPDDLIAAGVDVIPNASLLHASMGELSSGHYTNYPPLNQLFFATAAYLGGENLLMSVVCMRVFIIAADVAVFFYGLRLLRLIGKPDYLILLYFLNPFVIIELTGNLHWEGVMACLMLMGMYYFITYQRLKSPIFIGFSILLKLLPVMILPLLLKGMKWKKWFLFFGILVVTVVLGFAPFISADLIENYGSSVGLWFGTFEFNASVYYIIREIGFQITGYNVIGTVGKVLPVFTLISILLLAAIRKNQLPGILISSILFSFTIYLMLSTTVHPWYLTIPLLFSIFTKYRYMVLWSGLVFVSYSAYSNAMFQENMWWIGIEYSIIIAFLFYELWVQPRWMPHTRYK